MTRRPAGRARLEVSVTGGPATVRAAAGLARWLPGAAPARARGCVAIALLPDAAMRRLNMRFRGVDHATDVLSFPAGPDAARQPGTDLGDLAIALGVARRQARQEGHAMATELRILALHGLLHLLGYDHERDRGTMHRLEDRLRRRAGLPAGLIGRASSRANHQ
jgi:probable rRNA maturation factor